MPEKQSSSEVAQLMQRIETELRAMKLAMESFKYTVMEEEA